MSCERSYRRDTLYFLKAGKQNTDILLKSIMEYNGSNESNINHIIVSSTTGYTAFELIKIFQKVSIPIIVCKQDLNENYSMSESVEKELSNMCRVIDIPKKYLTNRIGLNGVSILRYFSQGMKVCIELLVYLLEINIFKKGENIILIGGTVHGADTAILTEIISDNDFKVINIIAFPER